MNSNDELLIKKYIKKEKQEEALDRLKLGYPVQYIIGNVEFLNTIIDVNENVLIPRFETEFLVDYLIKNNKFNNPNILDIGTGSGCIAIALKKNINCNVTGIDISDKAIEVAKSNALKNAVSVNFISKKIEDFNETNFDIIVSNPPYVKEDEYVDPKTKYEPQNALFASDKGLYFYKLILDKSKNILKNKGLIAFEIGSTQANDISSYAKNIYPNAKITVKKDLNNFDRYIFIDIE